MATTALAVTASVGSYLAFYTGYDKYVSLYDASSLAQSDPACRKSKTLKTENVTDVLLVKKGADHTAVQLNKVLALSGLTQLGESLRNRVATGCFKF